MSMVHILKPVDAYVVEVTTWLSEISSVNLYVLSGYSTGVPVDSGSHQQ